MIGIYCSQYARATRVTYRRADLHFRNDREKGYLCIESEMFTINEIIKMRPETKHQVYAIFSHPPSPNISRKLLFDIFDVDKRGHVTMAELDAMLRMLHGSPEADAELLRLLAVHGSEDEDALTFDEFLQVGSVVSCVPFEKAYRRLLLRS